MTTGRLLLAASALACALVACKDPPPPGGSTPPPMTEPAPAKTGTDLASLEKLIALPRRPQVVKWRKSLLGQPGLGPTDWQLIAVLDYAEADAKALQASLTPAASADRDVDDGGWLEPAVRDGLKKATAYDASGFYRAPLQHGALYALPGGNRWVLVLFTL